MRIERLLLFAFLMLSLKCLGQENYDENEKHEKYTLWYKNKSWGIGGSYSFKTGICEIGIIRASFDEYMQDIPIKMTAFHVGIESPINTKECIGYNVSVEHSFMIFTSKLAIVDYTNFKKNELVVRPQIGLSLFGFINLNYGYGFTVDNRNFENVSGYYCSISLNILFDAKPK